MTTIPATGADARISDEAFDAIRRLVYDRFGISLGDHKKMLVVGRLQKVLRQRGFGTFQDYYDWLEQDRSGDALDELANRITTNHTFFYREHAHFDFFARNFLPEAAARVRGAGRRDLRVWCAGCSTGQEPYTLMMLMRDFLSDAACRPLLLATDISASALRQALHGVYETEHVAKLPASLRNRYFDPAPGGQVRVNEDLRKSVVFRRHNLMSTTFPFRESFQAIFCRNVMIYFDHETRRELVAKFHRHTAPGGYLFIGHSESLGHENEGYEYVAPSLYRRR